MQSFTDNRKSIAVAELSDLSQPMQDRYHRVVRALSAIHKCTRCGCRFALVASIGQVDRCSGLRDHYCDAEETLADMDGLLVHRDLLPVLKQAVGFDPPFVVDHPGDPTLALLPRTLAGQQKNT